MRYSFKTDPKKIAAAILRLYRGDPRRWTKKVSARPSKRSVRVVAPESEAAGCWCLYGACTRVNGHVWALSQALKLQGVNDIIDFNDDKETRFKDMLTVLRRIVSRHI